jgi:hypothetical protein
MGWKGFAWESECWDKVGEEIDNISGVVYPIVYKRGVVLGTCMGWRDDEDIQTEDSVSTLIRATSPWWTASHVQTSSMISAEEARRCFSVGSQIWGGASANPSLDYE